MYTYHSRQQEFGNTCEDRQGACVRTFFKGSELTAGTLLLYRHTQAARLHDEEAAACNHKHQKKKIRSIWTCVDVFAL